MATTTHPGTAIVTGASSGIGAVYADRLADRGYDLVLVARRKAELEAQAKVISGRTGRRVDVLVADLSQSEGQALVEKRLHDDTNITLLVNSAGLASNGASVGSDPAQTEKMLTINILALTRLAAAAANAFAARKRGTIINLASAMAFITWPRTATYAASKAYVLNFSRGLAEEVAAHGVRVQAVLPGYTRTPMLSDELLAGIPAEAIMEVGELVDAALAGLDQGETVTIPSLPDIADWEAFDAARAKLTGQVSLRHPAARYGVRQKAA